jgi:hypothetical protein
MVLFACGGGNNQHKTLVVVDVIVYVSRPRVSDVMGGLPDGLVMSYTYDTWAAISCHRPVTTTIPFLNHSSDLLSP